MSGRVLGLGIAVLIAAELGCGGGAGRADSQSAPSRVLKRTPVVFTELRGEPFAHALVRAVVAGTPTLLLIDTGASHHVLADWLVRQAGLRSGRTRFAGRGHAGERLRVAPVAVDDLRLADWGRLDTGSVISARLPHLLERMGIGGVLSPQLLQEGDAQVELSFSEGELRLLSAAAPVSEQTRASFRSRSGADLCWAEQRGRKATKYLIAATADGHPARLEVDTGATRTRLRASSAAGGSISETRETAPSRLHSAGRVHRAERTLASVSIGELQRTLLVDLVPGDERPGCPADGALGMDVLRSCALLFDHTGFAARCPSAPPPAI